MNTDKFVLNQNFIKIKLFSSLDDTVKYFFGFITLNPYYLT
jgi:hypothetical protein